MTGFRPTPTKRFTGAAAEALPPYEQAALIVIAEAFEVQPEALAAIRIVENGGSGNEFGVIKLPDVDTYGEECRVAAEAVRRAIHRYGLAAGLSPFVGDKLTLGFWQYLQQRYLGQGAEQDIERTWARRCYEVYRASGVATAPPAA